MAQTASSEPLFGPAPNYTVDQCLAMIARLKAQDEHDKACGRESAIVRFVRAQLSTSPPEDHASAQRETS